MNLLFALALAWSTSGPLGGPVTSVVVAPSDSAVVWAASPAGAFRSADAGATWTDVSHGAFVDVVSIAVHPADANKAWALTATGHVYRTADGGATWQDSDTGLLYPRTLLIDPRDPDTLYAGGDCGEITLEGPVDYDAQGAGVMKSADGGATWTLRTAGLGSPSVWSRCAYELSIDPFASWRLFISGPFSDVGGQSESYDAAASWVHFFKPRPARGVVFDPRYPCTHYGITTFASSLMVSQDCGFTWAEVPGTLPGNAVSLSIDPERGRLFLGTGNGIFRSGDGGRVWATTLAPEVQVNALSFATTPPALFAATSAGLCEVENRGLGEAHAVDLQQMATDIGAMAVDPNDAKIVYASRRDAAAVVRSADGGASWERLSGDVPRIDFLSVDGGGTLYAASLVSQSVYRRDGDGWTVVRNHAFISAVQADPKNAGTVFIQALGHIERTRDGGATWQRAAAQTTSSGGFAIDPNDPHWVYFVSPNELLRSSDGGETWTNIEPFAVGKSGGLAIVVAPADGQVLYRISAANGRLQRSDDRGLTWQSFGPQAPFAGTIAVDPHDAKSVWITSSGSIQHSTDGGATWTTVAAPHAGWSAQLLRFDATGHTLHVAFKQHGVWELVVN